VGIEERKPKNVLHHIYKSMVLATYYIRKRGKREEQGGGCWWDSTNTLEEGKKGRIVPIGGNGEEERECKLSYMKE